MGEAPVVAWPDSEPWADVAQRVERGETVSVKAHGDVVADVVPHGELERMRGRMRVALDEAARAYVERHRRSPEARAASMARLDEVVRQVIAETGMSEDELADLFDLSKPVS